jgi:CheY-like chemotaxis protein
MILTSDVVTLPPTFCAPYERPPGRYVHLSLTDTGTGMDEATLARIFDPFFTTKEVGQGTGLGLATAYAIIKHHRGIIRVDSRPGQGSTFHLFLPVSVKPAPDQPSRDDAILRGTGTILLVDDEYGVRTVAGRILEQLGYQVLSAASGREAVEVFRREGHRIDLVLLDMLMPGMGGAQTFQELQKLDPGVRVLLSSGYSLDGEAQQVMAAGARGFMQKPYRLAVLSRKVGEVLGISARSTRDRPAPP